MTWNDMPEQKKDYIEFKDRETVRLIIRGRPVVFRQHWIQENNKRKSYVCKAPDVVCEYCDKGIEARNTFKVNCIIKNKEGHYEAKVLQQGPTVYKQLQKLIEAGYNPLDNFILSITRTGEGFDTEYSIVIPPPPNGVVSPELETTLSSVKIHDLGGFVQMTTASSHSSDANIPF